MRRIAVLTSGGDAPGMNAAIRAVVRTAIDAGFEAAGVRDGFDGLMAGRFVPLGARDVGGIIQSAGTVLRCARAPAFTSDAGQHQALEALTRAGIEALVVIGGNGSLAGADASTAGGSRSSASRPRSTTTSTERTSPSASTPRSTSRSRRSIVFAPRPLHTAARCSWRSWDAAAVIWRSWPASPAARKSSISGMTQRGEAVTTPLQDVVTTPRPLDATLVRLARVMAR